MQLFSELRNSTCFITGGSGFVGNALANRLLELDVDVVTLTKHAGIKLAERNPKIKSYVGDVRDYRLISDIVASHEVDYVIHLAANSIVRSSARDPMNTYDINVMGTVTVLEAVRNVGSKVKKTLVASSDKAYGDHEILPYVESMALEPKNTYDTSKACADLIARSYAANYDMPVVVTRCSNIYGPGDPNQSRLIPNTIRRIMSGRKPALYHDVASMRREFVYIDDAIDAMLGLLLSGNETDGESYNVGGVGDVEIENVVNLIFETLVELKLVSNQERGIEWLQRDSTFREIQKQYVDASKLFEATGWKQATTLRDGLAKTCKWYYALNGSRFE